MPERGIRGCWRKSETWFGLTVSILQPQIGILTILANVAYGLSLADEYYNSKK
jgi:hypothetical protein